MPRKRRRACGGLPPASHLHELPQQRPGAAVEEAGHRLALKAYPSRAITHCNYRPNAAHWDTLRLKVVRLIPSQDQARTL